MGRCFAKIIARWQYWFSADLEDWGERCYVKDLKSRNKVDC